MPHFKVAFCDKTGHMETMKQLQSQSSEGLTISSSLSNSFCATHNDLINGLQHIKAAVRFAEHDAICCHKVLCRLVQLAWIYQVSLTSSGNGMSPLAV